MAKKGSRVFEPVSTPLEDVLEIEYYLVGRQEWFDARFEPDAYDPEQQILIAQPSDLDPIIQWMWSRRILGYDTETTGRIVKGDKNYSMNPVNEDNEMVLAQLGDETRVYLIEPALLIYFKEVLETNRILHLLQNALYDFKWTLRKYNIHLDRIFDTMLGEQVLTAGLLGVRVGLADITRKYDPYYLISKAVRAMFVALNGGKMTREMVYYAARDIPLLFPVFRAQIKELKDKKLEKTAALEFSCIPCTAEMELEGVYLKKDKLQLLIDYWLERQDEMGQEILDLYSEELLKQGISAGSLIPELGEVFDLNSAAQKLEALRMLGFELDDTKRDTLLSVDHPVAALLAKYSNVTKMTSTYGENMMQKINAFTGKWHPRFAQMGAGESEGAGGRDSTVTTATGRYASDAQQFPRKQELYALLKDAALKTEVQKHFAGYLASLKLQGKDLAA